MSSDRRDDFIHVSIRRIDQTWRVLATVQGAEYTHYERFPYRQDAWYLSKAIVAGLAQGHDLDLRYWEAQAL